MSKEGDLYERHSLSRVHGDWSIMVGESFRLLDPAFHEEVVRYACKIMSRANSCLDGIVENLLKEGYRFVDPKNVRRPPDPDVWDWIKEYEQQGVYLPISLQAWLAEVGNIDLRGSHSNWSKPGYVFDDMPPTNDVWYADPLVIEFSRDYIEFYRDEWKSRIQEEGPENVGPFKISVSPDHITKANVSGGPPYQLQADIPVVDSLLYNERHFTSFTGYIRCSLQWGGFPGFEYIENLKQTNFLYRDKKMKI